MTLVNNFTYSTQFRLPNRLEKIDLQFQSCESFAFLKSGSVGDAHGCIGYVTKDTAMKYTHRIGMLFTGLEFNDCLSASDRRELKADQLRYRRQWGIPLKHGLDKI